MRARVEKVDVLGWNKSIGDDGYIYLTKLQQSGGILKMSRVLDVSLLLGNFSGWTMGPTSTHSSSLFCSASVIRNFLTILSPRRGKRGRGGPPAFPSLYITRLHPHDGRYWVQQGRGTQQEEVCHAAGLWSVGQGL